MILKLFFGGRYDVSYNDPKRADPPVEYFVRYSGKKYLKSDQPKEKEDDLNSADDGESSEESHGASNKAQLTLQLDLLVSLDVVKGCRVKVDLHHTNCGIMSLLP